MRPFRTLVVLRQPIDAVWPVIRDRLPELVEMIDDIRSITPVEREELGPGRIRLVNEWHARQQVPEVLRASLPTGEIGWLDRNVWDESARVCSWEIEPFLLAGEIRCTGTTTYEPAMGGRGCRVTFSGTFELLEGALSGLAPSLQRPATAMIESLVGTLIPRNTRTVLEAAATLAGRKPEG